MIDTRASRPEGPQELYGLFGMNRDGSPMPSPRHHTPQPRPASLMFRFLATMTVVAAAATIVFSVLASNNVPGREGWITPAGSATGIIPHDGPVGMATSSEFGCVKLPLAGELAVGAIGTISGPIEAWNDTRLEEDPAGTSFGWVDHNVAAPYMHAAEARLREGVCLLVTQQLDAPAAAQWSRFDEVSLCENISSLVAQVGWNGVLAAASGMAVQVHTQPIRSL